MLESRINESVTSVTNGRRCLLAISSSIVAFIVIIVVGSLILPKNANAWKLLGVVDFAICSAILACWFPGTNTLNKTSIKMLVISVVAAIAVNYFNYLIGSIPLKQNYINEFNSYNMFGRIIYVVIICVIAPISEEIYFRGFLFPIASTSLGAPVGAILSAILFIISHMSLNIVIVTVIYTYLVYRTRSVFTSIVAHITYNSIWIVSALWSQP